MARANLATDPASGKVLSQLGPGAMDPGFDSANGAINAPRDLVIS
jgi:hypothetical protein